MNDTQETKARPSAPRDDARPPSDDRPPKRPKKSLLKRPLVAGLLFLVVIVAAVGGTLWWLHSRHYEATDDAYLDVTTQQVSAQIAGRVARVLVDDNRHVESGTLLVELESDQARTALAQAQATVARADAQFAQARAQKATLAAQAEEARANLGVAQTNATNTDSDLRRLAALRADDAGAVSQEQWDRATAAEKTATARVVAAQKAAAAAEAQVESADSQIAAARAAQATAAAQVEQAQLQLSYTRIVARVAGRIASNQVAPGNFVQPGLALMAVVPTDVHVTANFKETQLTEMRPGQPVKIRIDAYPDLQLEGRVDSFQPGTGQAFSALPAENATGNWVKVVQRIPVKITLRNPPADESILLGPGMSVTATVTVR